MLHKVPASTPLECDSRFAHDCRVPFALFGSLGKIAQKNYFQRTLHGLAPTLKSVKCHVPREQEIEEMQEQQYVRLYASASAQYQEQHVFQEILGRSPALARVRTQGDTE